jgi:hypothetical protein
MASLRRKKSKKQQAGDLLVDYLKLRTASKAAKGAGKGAKKAAKGTAVQVAKRPPLGKRLPLVLGAAAAVAVGAKLIHGHRGDPATV